ncbi:MAG: sugar transferase [Acidimicrobiia bacterium]|nr:sugar transferase [Acidimicrobiia bacterium]
MRAWANSGRTADTTSGRFARLLDGLILFTIWTLVLDLNPFTERTGPQALALAGIATIVQLIVASRRGAYTDMPLPARTDEVATTITSTLAAGAGIALVAEIFNWPNGARELILGAVIVMAALAVSAEIRRSRRAQLGGERVVIVGTGDEAMELAELFLDHADAGFQLMGVVGDQAVALRHGLGEVWLGPVDDLLTILDRHDATTAVVAPSSFRSHSFRTIINNLLANGHDVALSSGVSRIGVHRHVMSNVVHEPLVLLESQRVPAWHYGTKRALDIIGASVGLLIASPLLVLSALAIKISDRGPILYRQARIGRHGEEFDMLKLRTMTVGADQIRQALAAANLRSGPLFKLNDDPRVTRLGRVFRELSIDELPQLINVLKGDMSLVGPRPALPSEVAKFDDELRQRSNVRPGITGLWQVEARSNASFSAYRRLDLHYLDNQTPWLDLRILVATAQLLIVGTAMKAVRRLFSRSGVKVDGIDLTPAAPSSIDLRRPSTESPGLFDRTG